MSDKENHLFFNSVLMHDTIIGLFINKVAIGADIHAKLQA
jgi:hypothetical protein